MKSKDEIYCEWAKKLVSLKSTSQDKTAFLTEDARLVINFDSVAKAFWKKRKLNEIKSNDALFFNLKSNRWVFVEFKNGSINKQEEHEIRKKNYDSVLIFSEISEASLAEIRENTDYILVYNDVKHAARNAVGNAVSELAKEPVILYGLQMFQNYCFSSVRTLSQAEFDCYMAEAQLHGVGT